MIKVFALNLSMLYQFNLEPDTETSYPSVTNGPHVGPIDRKGNFRATSAATKADFMIHILPQQFEPVE